MVGKLIGFWVVWFLITVLIGKVWPESVDGGTEKTIPISFGNGAIGFIVTVILFLVFGR